jgi:uncharacterized protein YdeI (YjbR/CyaY-like superfamily)
VVSSGRSHQVREDDARWRRFPRDSTHDDSDEEAEARVAGRLVAEIGFGEGRVRPAGLAAIESAKADGRWAAAYDSQSRASVPSDLQRALDSNAEAQSFFETLDSHNRYAILYRVHDARSPETRAKRIAAYVQMLAEGETLHPRKKKRD